MHEQIQNVAKDALRLGGTLPETMKPIAAGLLAVDKPEGYRWLATMAAKEAIDVAATHRDLEP